MNYKIKYQKKVGGTRGNFEATIVRNLFEDFNGWMLKDAYGKNIRKFNDVASAMTWIDEERRGI